MCLQKLKKILKKIVDDQRIDHAKSKDPRTDKEGKFQLKLLVNQDLRSFVEHELMLMIEGINVKQDSFVFLLP